MAHLAQVGSLRSELGHVRALVLGDDSNAHRVRVEAFSKTSAMVCLQRDGAVKQREEMLVSEVELPEQEPG